MDEVLAQMSDFHVCPNTGRVLQSPKHDDKVLCTCGRANPQVETEAPGVHIKTFLVRSTFEAYKTQG